MGSTIIYIAFFSALLSTVFYFLTSRGNEKYIKYARVFFHISVISTISSAAYLLYLIMSHQFQYTYVWNYSSKNLPLNLLLSTFYAGQEGSFHLWGFFMALLGIVLLQFLIRRDNTEKIPINKYEPIVMTVFTFIQTFLAFILILKSPYLFVWESFPKEAALGFTPEDGRGLNPLLQNFWMTIHPPILFAGFSALAVPFCFAIAALIKNQYNKWMKLALPWTLFAGMILGLGIMLGGYWAYGVLGWGGYWGWDPVENSSFVPWIIIVAAMHTMVSEEKTGGFKKTSLTLCIIAFAMVLYSTFLTRSGILGDASVHSFVDPGQEVYIFLVAFLILFGAGGIGLVFYRLKSLKSEDENKQVNILSRESALFVGAVTLCAIATVIAVGTSWPLFSKGTVDPAFYNKMNLPLAIMMALINGISILLAWKHNDEKKFMRNLYLPAALAVAGTIIISVFASADVLIAVFIASSIFSLVINAKIAYSIFIKNRSRAGAYVAHLGIMILFLGIIGSSKYSEEVNMSLPLNEPKDAMGYKMTYKGSTPYTENAEEKYHFNVIVEKDGKSFLLQPIMYYSEYSQGIMKNPDIANLVTKDVYLSPMSLETPKEYSDKDVVTLKKGEEKDVKGMKMKFVEFDRSKFNQESMQEGKENTMGAEIEIITDKGREKLIAEQLISGGQTTNIPVTMNSSDKYTFYLVNVKVGSESEIELAVKDNDEVVDSKNPEILVLTASVKPFINFVWAGTGIMVLGFFFSLFSRYKKFSSVKKETAGILIKNNLQNKNGNHTNGSHKKHSESHAE